MRKSPSGSVKITLGHGRGGTVVPVTSHTGVPVDHLSLLTAILSLGCSDGVRDHHPFSILLRDGVTASVAANQFSLMHVQATLIACRPLNRGVASWAVQRVHDYRYGHHSRKPAISSSTDSPIRPIPIHFMGWWATRLPAVPCSVPGVHLGRTWPGDPVLPAHRCSHGGR